MNSTNNGKGNGIDLDALSIESIEQQLEDFERQERERLGLPTQVAKQWIDEVPNAFTAKQRAHTTILVSGLTMAHDLFMQASLRGIGYKVQALDVPDNTALQYGREYGNRGQCNPTYFTVGNLVKHLAELKEQGRTKDDIVENYLFVTAGACGPCRFGTYVTEYRKALRDSGFDGFRVLLFQQTGGLKQATGDEIGLQMNPQFFWAVVRSVLIGDALNALGYRIRPYEVEAGSTDRALEMAKKVIADAFEQGNSMVRAMYRARKILGAVKVDRTRIKPKVGIIGEFWAMTTEGEGNYALQRFLESEGAEVDVQPVTAWLLYMLWQSRYDTAKRAELHGTDKKSESKFSLEGVDVRKRVLSLWAGEKVLRNMFGVIATSLGLNDYHLSDMDEVAEISHEFYDNNLRGGEGHMEIGKLIQNVAKSKVNMTVSVKPFGCMPSSSVSDGVQSMITELYPQAIFLPIETNGDGAVNVYSRVQMQLFKAKQFAAREVEQALSDVGMTMEQVQAWLKKNPAFAHAFYKAPHHYGSTTADLVHAVGARKSRFAFLKNTIVERLTRKDAKDEKAGHEKLLSVARRAAEKVRTKKSVVTVAPLVTESEAESGPPPIPAGRKSLRVVN